MGSIRKCGHVVVVKDFGECQMATRIGDFEGNFCTNVLSVTLGGEPKGGLPGDHICISGDPHGGME